MGATHQTIDQSQNKMLANYTDQYFTEQHRIMIQDNQPIIYDNSTAWDICYVNTPMIVSLCHINEYHICYMSQIICTVLIDLMALLHCNK